EARRSLGLQYLHLPFGRTGNLDRFLDFYEQWLRQRDWRHTPARFRAWAACGYRGGSCAGRVEVLGLVLSGSEAVAPARPLGWTYPGPNARLRVRVPRAVPFGLRVRCHNDSDQMWHFHPFEN